MEGLVAARPRRSAGSSWSGPWRGRGTPASTSPARSRVGRCTRPTWMIRSPFASRKSAVVLANPAVPARNPASASFFSTIVVVVVTSALRRAQQVRCRHGIRAREVGQAADVGLDRRQLRVERLEVGVDQTRFSPSRVPRPSSAVASALSVADSFPAGPSAAAAAGRRRPAPARSPPRCGPGRSCRPWRCAGPVGAGRAATRSTNRSPNSVLGSSRADTFAGISADHLRLAAPARAGRRCPVVLDRADLADDQPADLDVGRRLQLDADAVGLQGDHARRG